MTEQPLRYQIPTHLGTPDTLDLPLFGITVSLTIRQAVCFLLGGSLVFRLWEQTTALTGLVEWLVHDGACVLLAFATTVIAIQKIQHRFLEEWGLILVQYLSRPKVFLWRTVLEEISEDEDPEAIHPTEAIRSEEEEDACV